MSFGYFASDLIDARRNDAMRNAEAAVSTGATTRTGGRVSWPRRLAQRVSARRARPVPVTLPSPRQEIDLSEPALAQSADA